MNFKPLVLMITFILSFIVIAGPIEEAIFIDQMKGHHQKAIALSEQAFKISRNKDVVKLAGKIKKDFARELNSLMELEKKVEVELTATSMDLIPMPQFIESTVDHNYLTAMIKNHEDSIIMASKLLPHLKRRDIHHLALKIIKREGQEIDKMQKLKLQTIR